MGRYSTRIAGMHLKDVHADQAKASKAAGASYHEATRGKFTVWTEPGRGDIDLPAAFGRFPHHLTAGSLSRLTCPRPRQTSSLRKFPQPGLPSSSARMHLPLIAKRQRANENDSNEETS